MKLETLDILRCPVCLGELEIKVDKQENEIIKGTLTCKNCGRSYMIEDGIPMMLPELARMDKK
ncbi:MAG: Trm112 family protein [Thermoplasmata archaeon]